MGIPLHIIRQTAAARIAALSATAYAQGTGVTAAWNESLSPFGQLDGQGDATTHLEFCITFGAITAGGRDRYTPGSESEFTGTMRVEFRWDIDPGGQIASYDLAMQAAHDILVSLNNDGAWATVAGEVQTIPLQRFGATLIPGVLAMLVEVTFTLIYSEGV